MCQIFVFVGSLFANHHCGVTVYKSFWGVSMYKSSCWGQCVQTMFVGSACTNHLWSRGRSVPCYKSWCFSWVWLADHPLTQSSQQCVLLVSELVVQCPLQCHHHRHKNLQMNLYNTKKTCIFKLKGYPGNCSLLQLHWLTGQVFRLLKYMYCIQK